MQEVNEEEEKKGEAAGDEGNMGDTFGVQIGKSQDGGAMRGYVC